MRFLLLSFILAASCVSFGDISKKDPVTSVLRAEFTSGKVPLSENLPLGKTYRCSEHSATFGKALNVSDSKVVFEKTDGYYRMSSVSGGRKFDFAAGPYGLQSNLGTLSTSLSTEGFWIIRALPNGDFIMEVSISGLTKDDQNRLLETAKADMIENSAFDPSRFVISYTYCTPLTVP